MQTSQTIGSTRAALKFRGYAEPTKWPRNYLERRYTLRRQPIAVKAGRLKVDAYV
jgi:hypothetical protein